MERYFPKVAKTSKQEVQRRERKLTAKELNRGLLRSLTSKHNPITHSDAGDRADRVVSISTGHQVNEERINRRLYLEDREKKLGAQPGHHSSDSTGVLRSVRVYLSGYLKDTTELEMKRIISEAGGETVLVPSRCTHIVTSQWLSGSKTHRLLATKMRNKPYVVRPEWIFESITKNKRQPERTYVITLDNSHASITT
ncbi:hypothetical protein P691DRAFT_796463 [Macrolepiota fuliginosa MF-IS2]|uniref:BRCT domain-containing protein n=1 Tax=Macrolepiota fuliginosa MF-IS2 TaxID=1400762 RepID=A0A9P6C7Z6_9AGAR|nr:hypothetical protein P691DRAFT_796463 [Macrolepiota fuliginosa MF-IS2]